MVDFKLRYFDKVILSIIEHILHSAAPVQSCQMNTYVRSQIAYLVVEKRLCPIAF